MRFFVLVSAGLAGSLALAPRARACDCAPYFHAEIWAEDGAPRNAEPLVIWSPEHGDVQLELLEAETLAPRLQVTTTWDMGSTLVSRMEPLEPFESGHAYVVRVSATVEGKGDDDTSDWSVIEAEEFSVSGAEDDAAPLSGEILAITALDEEDTGASCGPHRWISVDLEPGQDESPVFYEVEVATTEDLADAVSLVFTEPSFEIGSELCWATWRGIEEGGSYWVRARAVDLAGNLGDWSAAQSVTLVPTYPDGDGGGDTAVGDDTGAPATGGGSKDEGCGGKSLILVGLSALLARRRR